MNLRGSLAPLLVGLALLAVSSAAPERPNPRAADPSSAAQLDSTHLEPTDSTSDVDRRRSISRLPANEDPLQIYRSDRTDFRNSEPSYLQAGYQFGVQPQRDSYVPLVRSFQAASYVHDDVPSMIFFLEGRDATPKPPLPESAQISTVTERSNVLVNVYFDEHDTKLGLTKEEERIKIFYDGKPELVPPFRNMAKEEEARKKQNQLFKYFKSQRANTVLH